MIFNYYYPEYESKLGIDHSRIVDLLQVFDTIPTAVSRVCGIWRPRLGGRSAFLTLKSMVFGVPKHLMEIKAIFGVWKSLSRSRKAPSTSGKTDLRDTGRSTGYHDHIPLHSPIYKEEGANTAVDRSAYSMLRLRRAHVPQPLAASNHTASFPALIYQAAPISLTHFNMF